MVNRRILPITLGVLTTAAIVAACSTPADNEAAVTEPPAKTSTATATTSSAASESEPESATPSAPTTMEATTEKSQGLSPLGAPDLEDKQASPGQGTDLIPKNVRVADHGGFTRVVLDFDGSGQAGWFTQTTSQPAQQASGFPIEYDGATAINIGIESTPWPSTPEREAAFMDYGTTPGAGVVTGVEFVTTFEAQSQYVIGLKKESAYSVTFLEGPPRVVIDIVN